MPSWNACADKAAKLAIVMDQTEPDVLATMTLPREHRSKLQSTNLLERLNGEIKRRTNVVGVRPLPRTAGGRASLPNNAAIIWLIGAILLEQNDEWAVRRARTMTLETIAQTGQCWPTEPGCTIDRRDKQGLSIDGELRWSASWGEAEGVVAPV